MFRERFYEIEEKITNEKETAWANIKPSQNLSDEDIDEFWANEFAKAQTGEE